MRCHYFAIGLLLAITATATAQSTKSSYDRELDAVYARFSEGYRSANPQMVAELYTRDAFYLQPGKKIERGHDHVLNAFSFLNSYKNRARGPTIGFRIVDREVRGDIGWDIGYYLMNGEGKPIGANEEPGGKFIVLWKRGADGQWRIFADGYSAVEQPASSDPARARAQQAVTRAVQAYFDGVTRNDSVQLDMAFHPDAQLSATLPDGRVYRAAYSEWRKFTSRPPGDATGKTNRIANIELMGNAAVVTTVLDWPTVRYVDYLSLIRTGADEWKIVSKIWHQQAKP
ncbi:MAG TPA: nuclear transport factor 2 family protein [Longimicrobiales bacterium]|nr:nuclear transport factor 2 family protein [Longimicrobiales bacterium]